MTLAILYVVIAAILCVAALLALLGVGHLRLSGARCVPESLGSVIEHDGLARGERAPSWRLTDVAGHAHASPPGRPLQLIVFADHSLKSFPSVVAGLRALADDADVEIVILTRGIAAAAAPVPAGIGLAAIPVLDGSAALYSR